LTTEELKQRISALRQEGHATMGDIEESQDKLDMINQEIFELKKVMFKQERRIV